MPDDFFDPLPTGPVAPSRRYFGRLQRAAEQSSRLVTAPTYPGNSGTDAVGPWLAPDFDEVVWALCTAPPELPTYHGHSWQQRLPDVDGSWSIPDTMMQGDNGTLAFTVTATVTEAELSGNIATFTTDEDPSGINPGDRVGIADVGEPYDGGWLVLSTPTTTTFTVQIIWPDTAPAGVTGTATVNARPAGGAAFDPNGASYPAGTMFALARGYLNVTESEWQWLILGTSAGTACSGTCTPPDDGRTYTSQGTACSMVISGFECDVESLEIVNTKTLVCFSSPVTIKTSTSTSSMPPCPAGTAATIDVNSTTTLDAGEDATVVNVGTTSAALLDFGIPRGFDGAAATITVGSVSALPPGSTPTVTNVGDSTDAVFDFGIPAGATGASGTAAGAALTKTDDANVTLSLGGSPSTALVNAASITVGWSGTLAVSRGGTNIGSYSVGDILYASGTTTLAALNAGTDGKVLTLASGVPSWATATIAGAALTKTDDTNVTLSLGGSPTTALAHAASITVGWTGTLGVARGGTNIASYTAGDILYATGSTTLAALNAGADGKILTMVSGAPAWADNSATVSGAALTKTDDTNVTLTLGGSPTTALVNAASITVGWSGQLAISRGGTNASTAVAAFNNLSPMTTLGDMIIGDTSGSRIKLGGNIGNFPAIMISWGSGSAPNYPEWAILGDILDAMTGWANGDIIMRVGGQPTKLTPISATYLTDVSVSSAVVNEDCTISITLSKTTATHKVLP